MLTKCPSCGTTFRVTPAQLKARAGKVRCGQCSHVFNALDTLDEDAAPALAETMPAMPSVALPDEADADVIDIGEVEPAIDEATETAPIDAVAEVVAETSAETEATAPDIEAAEFESPLAEEPAIDNAELTDYLASPTLHEPVGSRPRWPWVLGSVTAVIVLMLQILYYYRVEIAVLRPDLRPLLQTACKPLNCDVPRPRSIETLSIEASDLRPDPQQTGHLALSAILRSKAPYAQEWPLLELTITDVADRKLAVKNFAAASYLPKDKNTSTALAAGFPANGQVDVMLPLDVGDLPAAGYRLYIFYP